MKHYECSRCREMGPIMRVYYFDGTFHVLFRYCHSCLYAVFYNPGLRNDMLKYSHLRADLLSKRFHKEVKWMDSYTDFDAMEKLNELRSRRQECTQRKRKANQINEL